MAVASVLGGCSKPTGVGEWQSVANSPLKLNVSVRPDGTFSIVSDMSAVGVVVRYDGTYEKQPDGLILSIQDGKVVGGQEKAAMHATKAFESYKFGSDPAKLTLAGNEQGQLLMAGQTIPLQRGGSPIPTELTPAQQSFVAKAKEDAGNMKDEGWEVVPTGEEPAAAPVTQAPAVPTPPPPAAATPSEPVDVSSPIEQPSEDAAQPDAPVGAGQNGADQASAEGDGATPP